LSARIAVSKPKKANCNSPNNAAPRASSPTNPASLLAILIVVTIGLPQPQCEKNGKASDKEPRQMGQLM
jgi:hypothetical protein